MQFSTRTGERDGIATVTLVAGDLDATFATGAGMVCCSLRSGDEELLGQRRGLAAYAATGSTMGIPLLHPWANRLAALRYEQGGRTVHLRGDAPGVRLDGHGLPIHGLLAASPDWRVTSLEAGGTDARLVAELAFERHELLESFPFPHRLVLSAALDPGALAIALAVRATGDVPVPIAFGFHPYLQPGGQRAALEVSLPPRIGLALDERGIPTGATQVLEAERGPLGERSFDDLCAVGEEPVAFALTGAARTITVRFLRGYSFGQVFAPPGEPFVAFEPMTAPVSALTVPGECPLVDSYEAAFAVEVGSTIGT
jgi:aldose 1-epimerase